MVVKIEAFDTDEPLWVEFDEVDGDEPMQWSTTRKDVIAGTLSFFTSMTAVVGTSFAIGSASLEADLGCSHELSILGLVTYFAGFGIAPLQLAPLSELFGRTPVYQGASVIWLIFIVVTAVAKNIQTVVISRFIQGCAASTGATLVGGSIADMYEAHHRGRPMSIFAFGAFAGTGVGPLIFGYVAQNRSWRYIQYIQIALAGVCVVAIALFVKETRVSVILKRRAAQRRKETGDVSLVRPLKFLTTEPVVIAATLWAGWSWGCMFLCLESVPLVYQEVYGFNVGETGLVFSTLVIGSIIGVATNPIQERLYLKHRETRGPEARLFVACVGGLLIPSGIFIFGFSQGRGHWMGPSVGLVLLITGIFTVYVATFTYLADNYKTFASSALAGQSLGRNIFGTSIPLFAVQMYTSLGFQWASFLAGMMSLLLAATPFALMKYGPALRSKSKVVMQLHAAT